MAKSNLGELSSSWQRMQSRVLSAASAVRAIALRNSGLFGDSTCLDAGPWQFSHWFPLRWGVASADRQPEVYSKPVVWQVTHSASNWWSLRRPLGSWTMLSNAWACRVPAHLA